MNKDKELAIIKIQTNIEDEKRIVLNEIGWTSRVYIVDNGKFVFKFPRGKKWKKECKHEFNILKFIRDYEFNVNVPLIKYVGESSSYAVLHGVQGRLVTTELVNQWDETQKRNAGKQIGLFLKKLHSIDYNGNSPNNENDIIEWVRESFNKRKSKLKKYFNENEIGIIEELLTSLPKKLEQLGIKEVFCHGDLGYHNILISDNFEVGIIDFGDAGILDKSYDFTGLEDDTILDAAITAYEGDEVLREKVAIRRHVLPLMEMLFLIDRNDQEGIIKSAAKMRANLV